MRTSILLALALFVSWIGAISQTAKLHFDPVEITDLTKSANTLHRLTRSANFYWGVDFGRGHLYRSTDGRNWTLIATLNLEYAEVIQFVNASIGLICGDHGFVYRTEDEGRTWTDVSPSVPYRITEHFRNDTSNNELPFGNFIAYHSMHFSDTTNGYISGMMYNPKQGIRASMTQRHYQTTDSGLTWEEMDEKQLRTYLSELKIQKGKKHFEFNREFFLNDELSFSLKRDRNKNDLVIKQNTILARSDTFALQSTSHNNRILRRILFLDDHTGLIIGGTLGEATSAITYLTTDQGKTWELIPNSWPHIHDALFTGDSLMLSTKQNLLIRIPFK